MTRIICISIMFLVAHYTSIAKQQLQRQDSTIMVTIDDYWKRLLSINEKIYAIGCGAESVLKFQDEELRGFGQQIIKTDSSVYIHLAATGIIYKGIKENDSTLKFTRIDDTHNKYYNQGGHLITQNENLYIFGGYGFWKSNGHLKRFNYRDREWDIAPLSKEIHPPLQPKPGMWHDAKEEKIYLLYEYVINDAIVVKAKQLPPNDATYCLDLKTLVWQKESPLHPRTTELVKNGIHQLQNEKGIYLFKGIELYQLDIKSNRIFKMSDKSYSQSFARVLLQDMFYAVNNRIYFKEKGTGRLDSLILPLNRFTEEPYPIFTWTIPGYIYWMGILILLITVSLLAYTKINSDKIRYADASADFALKEKFSTSELSLISMLINKCRNKQRADISELNYVLGVKDKNMGLQKKVRSEAIQNINEKFKYIFGEETGLISSDRSKTDKRYFEYYISRDLLKLAEEIIRKNK
jgi:hypothetical protein